MNQTPLHEATSKIYIVPDSVKIVELLLKNPNIDVNIDDNNFKKSLFFLIRNYQKHISNNTPLTNAIQNQSAEIVNLLLLHQKIDVNTIHKIFNSFYSSNKSFFFYK